MVPRWESPFDPPDRRESALLADVLKALQPVERTDGDAPGPDGTLATEAIVPDPEAERLIQAAAAEAQRVLGVHRGVRAGIAPVLGAGVVPELLRRQQEGRLPAEGVPSPTVDHRL